MRQAVDRFVTTRADGRSDTQVILDLVGASTPGKTYAYAELQAALGREKPRVYTVPEVQSVVARALPRLLLEHQRTLKNIRHVGYQLASAADHLPLAHDRHRKGRVQISMAELLLREVHWEEMPEAQRQAHAGTLLIVAQQAAMLRSLHSRMQRLEDTVDSILHRATG